jgi:hypothetical protein
VRVASGGRLGHQAARGCTGRLRLGPEQGRLVTAAASALTEWRPTQRTSVTRLRAAAPRLSPARGSRRARGQWRCFTVVCENYSKWNYRWACGEKIRVPGTKWYVRWFALICLSVNGWIYWSTYIDARYLPRFLYRGYIEEDTLFSYSDTKENEMLHKLLN